MLTLLLGLTTADAAGWRAPNWYADPILSAGFVSVNGNAFAQATGGLEGGFRRRYRGPQRYLHHTRARGVATYGITSGSLGADMRIGSFVGPIWKRVVLQHGPDLWYSGYGQPGARDYQLAWSPGLDLYNGVRIKAAKGLFLNGWAVPGWAFNKDRRGGGVWIFDEVSLGAAVTARVNQFTVNVGYGHRWNAAGEQGFLILGGGFRL